MRLANPDLSDTHVRHHGISQVARVYFGVITPPLICACVELHERVLAFYNYYATDLLLNDAFLSLKIS